ILALDRITLVSYVVALRFKSNQLTAVKHEVIDFDYKKVALLTEAEVADSDTSKGGAIGGAEKLELVEQSVLLQLMLMIKNDKLDRDAKDRADMARLEAKERAEMDWRKSQLEVTERLENEKMRWETKKFEKTEEKLDAEHQKQQLLRERVDMRLGRAVKTMKHLMYMMPLTHSEIL